MTRRILAPLLIGIVVALFGAQSARAADPTLFVNYSMTCTFTITGDNGGAISVIPPGFYQIHVSSPVGFAEPDLSGVADPNYACGGSMSFRLTGPGVNLHTTLDGGDAGFEQFQATFQAGGTYVAVEDRRPTVARITFTAATGAASTGGGGSTGGTGGGSNTSTTKTNTTAPAIAVRGTLNGGVSTVGKLSLKLNGKTVASLKSGRYKLTVLDETSKRGFTIQKLGQTSTKVTGTTFLGRHSVTLTLKAGQWFYYSPSGKKNYFIVTG